MMVSNIIPGETWPSLALDAWQRHAIRILMESVRETSADGRLWPRDAAVVDRLLRFFIVEKAVYEVGYELHNRPDWVHVPLAGLWRTLFPSEATRHD